MQYNWFTVEKIDAWTFAISEYKHWEETHCYLLCGTERAILIDTGLGVANIKKVVENLTDLPVTVLTTHAHWDHIGVHKYFLRLRFRATNELLRSGMNVGEVSDKLGFSSQSYFSVSYKRETGINSSEV